MLSTKVREKLAGKTSFTQFLAALLVPAVVLTIGAAAPEVWAQGEFADADVYAELNDTDEDLGFHALIDGDAWKILEIEDPKGRQMLYVRVKGRLRRQGLTELFFESAEPPFDELSPAQFFRRFPEGEYEIEGLTLEGEELENTDLFRHVMPAAPGGIDVSGTPIDHKEVDCDEEAPVVMPEDNGAVVISWDEVNTSHPTVGRPGDIEADLYQVVVEQEGLGVKFSVDLPPDITSVEIPAGFIWSGLQYKFEILVKEAEGGNQTAAESCFAVEQ